MPVPEPNGSRIAVAHDPITISYADDEDANVLYWRCEAGDCPSRVRQPDGELAPAFVGTIVYSDREHAFTMLGSVAVAHATLLDQAPLGELRVEDIVERTGA